MKPTFKASSTLRNLSQRSLLAASVTAVMAVSSLSHALTPISEDELASSTGEGIAFLPEGYSLRMNNVDTPSILDTGYIRYIPVGPLTTYSQNSGAGKGDVFLYGLAISQTEATTPDFNSRYGTTIGSWGTTANPWVLRAFTDTTVPDFAGTTGSVSYLTLEAPAYNVTLPTTSAAGADAYKIKLAYWTDIFVRDPAVVEDMTATGTQFNLGGANRPNRLRLQAIWNGLSLNGSNIKVFQTLGGATNAGGLSTTWNNTLGLTGLLRFNSGPTNNTANGGFAAVTPATVLSEGLRLSTQETVASTTNYLLTPAINGGNAPSFAATEGMHAYSANINLVFGGLYQPLIFDVAPDNKNLIMEITRIPNQSAVYNKIYTDYSAPNSATYKGSTCSVYYCGATGGTYSTATYQGNSATHSSITIGTTDWDSTNRVVSANNSANSVGVSFGSTTSAASANNLGSAVIDGFLVQHMKITTKGL